MKLSVSRSSCVSVRLFKAVQHPLSPNWRVQRIQADGTFSRILGRLHPFSLCKVQDLTSPCLRERLALTAAGSPTTDRQSPSATRRGVRFHVPGFFRTPFPSFLARFGNTCLALSPVSLATTQWISVFITYSSNFNPHL